MPERTVPFAGSREEANTFRGFGYVIESEFLQWIYNQGTCSDSEDIVVGPGDDMAVINISAGRILAAVDQAIDGVHFDLAEDGPEAAGRKALARNLSDVAAMAAEPIGALASIAVPADFSTAAAKKIYGGMKKIGDAFQCPILGGDLAAWPAGSGVLHMTVAIVAKPGGDGRIAPVLRSNAQPGDAVCVTGALGGAWRSRHHLEFTPRVREALCIAEKYEIHSMIDISDGLAMDLHALCRASNTGAEITAAAVPVHPRTGGHEVEPLDAALHDGEDYELLFTLPASLSADVCTDEEPGVSVTKIGRITQETTVTIVDHRGVTAPLEKRGWEHRT